MKSIDNEYHEETEGYIACSSDNNIDKRASKDKKKTSQVKIGGSQKRDSPEEPEQEANNGNEQQISNVQDEHKLSSSSSENENVNVDLKV